MAKSNRPLLDELTGQQRATVLAGADAVKVLADFSRRTFDLWMDIARGVAVLCTIADRPGMSRKARKNLLKDNGYGTLNDSTVSRLRHMAMLETHIRLWRDSLTENKRQAWNSPTSICNRCPAVRKAIAEANKHKPPREPRVSNRHLAVQRALDVIGDSLHANEDDDERASIVEQVTAFVRQFTAAARKAAPNATEPKRKRKKAANPAATASDVKLLSLTRATAEDDFDANWWKAVAKDGAVYWVKAGTLEEAKAIAQRDSAKRQGR